MICLSYAALALWHSGYNWFTEEFDTADLLEAKGYVCIKVPKPS